MPKSADERSESNLAESLPKTEDSSLCSARNSHRIPVGLLTAYFFRQDVCFHHEEGLIQVEAYCPTSKAVPTRQFSTAQRAEESRKNEAC